MRQGVPIIFALGMILVIAPCTPGEETASAETDHDHADPPIDCPLREQGVDTHGLKPFDEVEDYIAFLERADRAAWQKPDLVVAALDLAGSEIVSDVGAGSGYFTFRLAEALPEGHVRAIDIEPEMLRHIHHKVLSDDVSNIEVVLATLDDPHVDAGTDLVFVCDVLHHVQERRAWLERLQEEMKPGARLVLIEFEEGDLPQGPPEALKVPEQAMIDLVSEAGFLLSEDRSDLLPYQTFLVFAKP